MSRLQIASGKSISTTRLKASIEDLATEFQVQDLELDWACVTWDGDFRYSPDGWRSFSFVAANAITLIKKKENCI